jgi:hypothetical protein
VPDDEIYDGTVRDYHAFNSQPPPPEAQPISEPVPLLLAGADLIRTQIHLSPIQRRFLTERANLTGKSMALIIRELIDREMNPQNTDWDSNPLLDEPVSDPGFTSPTSDSENSDQAIYGSYQG